MIVWQWHPEIVYLRTAVGTPALDGVGTIALLVGSKYELNIGGVGQEWELLSGTADPTDLGQVAPLDYNATTNMKFWNKVA